MTIIPSSVRRTFEAISVGVVMLVPGLCQAEHPFEVTPAQSMNQWQKLFMSYDPEMTNDPVRHCLDRLRHDYGTTLSGLLYGEEQMLASAPKNEGKARGSAYYWFQVAQEAWTGATFVATAEGGWGAGLDRLLDTFSILNDNAGEPSTFYIPSVFLLQSLLDEHLFFSLGKLDLSDWCDENEVANSADTAFLSGALINNINIPFPQKGLGFMARILPVEELTLAGGISDANAISTHTGFDTAFQDDRALFGIGQLGVSPGFWEDCAGNYRFILWHDDATREQLNGQGKADSFTGWALDFDQGILWGITLFGRYGYADPSVYEVNHCWSLGFQVEDLVPSRRGDMIGLGLAQSLLSADYRDSVDPRAAPAETIYEAYYAASLNNYMVLTPDVQFIHHPMGDSSANTAIALNLRLLVYF